MNNRLTGINISQWVESVICPENRDFHHSELTETAKWVVRTRNSFMLNDKKTQNLAWLAQIRWLLARGAEYGFEEYIADDGKATTPAAMASTDGLTASN